MGMGKQHGILKALFGHEPVAKLPDPGTGIDDDNFIILCPYFNAGRIASIFYVFVTRNRYGTSRTPAPDNHRICPFGSSLYCCIS
jgi:hypothetical protein